MTKKANDIPTMIQMRGVRVHNLNEIDVDIPQNAMTVITGVSGSGKSSLAFDALYAEGRRQYIDSLSPYARQFLDQIPRPDLDSIEGLAPTLAIDQKNEVGSRRSTVATITEIYDYLRLLFARIGILHCAACGSQIDQRDSDAICHLLCELEPKTKLVIMSPMVRSRRGRHQDVLEKIANAGLIRVRIDGEMYLLEDAPILEVRKLHSIDAVVDRLVVPDRNDEEKFQSFEKRLRDSIDLAIRFTGGLVTSMIQEPGRQEQTESVHSTAMACVDCGESYEEIETRTFSFNSPYGACGRCEGLGIIGKKDQSQVCPDCDGTRLGKVARSVFVAEQSIDLVNAMSLTDAKTWIDSVPTGLKEVQQRVAAPIVAEVSRRLSYLIEVGVPYLTLDRSGESLSGGESQRVRLATHLGSGLTGVCYILDEPSIGLHPRDHDRLLTCIRELQKAGNTVVVVEHDESTIRAADHLIDIGPQAGLHGGNIVAVGEPSDFFKGNTGSTKKTKRRSKGAVHKSPLQNGSVTAAYLLGEKKIYRKRSRRKGQTPIKINGVKTNNLKNVSVQFPTGVLLGVSGVSGSGKSSLINDTLYPALAKKLGLKTAKPGPHRSLQGADQIDKLIVIDQKPIGRNARSTPATYCGVMSEIRKVFATTRMAKTLGFGPGRFSYNSPGGRCEQCSGNGTETVEMNFLSDLQVRCSACQGRRFNRQTLQVRFKGASIADVLDMTIDQAAPFFENIPAVKRSIESLRQVGLGYLCLGQPSPQLSGGEAQRIKLATELAKPSTGKTLYLLDEPTTGLHFADIDRLLNVLHRLVDGGNTAIVIEHHVDFLASCDYLVDLGPSGGMDGGHILAKGTPEQVAKISASATGAALKSVLTAER